MVGAAWVRGHKPMTSDIKLRSHTTDTLKSVPKVKKGQFGVIKFPLLLNRHLLDFGSSTIYSKTPSLRSGPDMKRPGVWRQ